MMRIVTVCTANMCRSPFAEHALRRAFRGRGIVVEVSSTGVESTAGRGAPGPWLAVAAEYGVDLRQHLSSDPDDAFSDAGLVLTMTADHLRAAVVGWPHLLGKVVTLGEAVRRAEWGVDRPDELVAARTGMEVLLTSNADDVPDPIGRSRRVQRAVADHLVELCERLAASWPAPDPALETGPPAVPA